MWMQQPRLTGILIPLLAASLLCGCKLVEITMPGEPLSKQDVALRSQTREFATIAATTIEQVAGVMERDSKDPAILTRAAQWKIGAIGSLRKASLRTTPTLALLETWSLSRQMTLFLDQGPGATAFGPYQEMVKTNVLALQSRASNSAKLLLSAGDFKQMSEFVEDYAIQYPIKDFSFEREPAVGRWLDFRGNVDATPAGTTSEALSDLADRIQIVAQHVPDEVRWRVGMESKQMEGAMMRAGVTLERVDTALKRIAEAAASSPTTISNAVQELREGFLPVLDRFEKQWGTTLGTVHLEREALTKSLAVEREAVLKAVDQQRTALTQTVDQQRAAIMQDVHKLTTDTIEQSMQQVRGLVRDVLFYAVLLAVVILGIPFFLGVWVGRVSTKRATGAAATPSK